MSLQNVQAQLGNLLAAMPLKLQKVSSSFLDSVDPPFEGAIASDSDGQFYVSQVNSGELVWQQIVDKSARDAAQGVSDSEFIGSFSLPVGLDSSTISYGKTLQGSKFSVFVQYEPPENSDVMYIFSVKNITNQQFDLMMSDDIKEEGGKIHIFARGYDQSSAGSMDVVYPPVEPMSPEDYTVTGHAGNVGHIFDGDLDTIAVSNAVGVPLVVEFTNPIYFNNSLRLYLRGNNYDYGIIRVYNGNTIVGSRPEQQDLPDGWYEINLSGSVFTKIELNRTSQISNGFGSSLAAIEVDGVIVTLA